MAHLGPGNSNGTAIRWHMSMSDTRPGQDVDRTWDPKGRGRGRGEVRV